MKNGSSFLPIVVFAVAIAITYGLNQAGRGGPADSGSQAGDDGDRLVFPAEADPSARVEPVERRTAKNYYVVFDGSGSMDEVRCSGNGRKIEVAKVAVQEFISKIPGNANVGLAAFDGQGLTERVPLSAEKRDVFAREIEAVKPFGSTPLRSAIRLAASKLAAQAALQLGYGEYHLVVVTDGEADSDEDPQGIVNSILKSSPIVVHTVGFCIGTEHSLNQPGRVFYQSADNPEELRQGLTDVLAEATTFNVDEFKAPN